MNSADISVSPRQRRSIVAQAASRVRSAPRVYVYLACTAVAVLVSYLLGKDMQWDTLDYHLYAGFSALHDRFRQDYFAAGSQAYFNPYAYVPFYLLARSGLPALAVASLLAVVQSAILWLTYELALEVAPAGQRRIRLPMALAAVAFALANPILINQFGSSYVDVTTGELALAGWLLLVRALPEPVLGRIICAGLLLGAASALKPTNAVHAVSACVLLLFLRESWAGKIRHGAVFGLMVALGFAIVCAPWSIPLQRHFGNPLFPLLNNVFRSRQFPTAPMVDYRFLPDSLGEALLRPFAIALPEYMVDDEFQAPDLRYAVLLGIGALFALRWLAAHRRGRAAQTTAGEASDSSRALVALGCAFLVDWILWLIAAANGRYFIPAACVAAVIAVALIFRVFERLPRVRNYVLVAILAAQAVELCLGAGYRDHVPWDGGPWFEVKVPQALATTPALYLSYGVQSASFVVPFLDSRSGFINIAGDYPLAPGGANGAQVALRLRRYWPHVRMIALLPMRGRRPVLADLSDADDALQSFHLRADPSDCTTIAIADEGRAATGLRPAAPGKEQRARAAGADAARNERLADTGYLTSCGVVSYDAADPQRDASERRATFVLDRLEDACPEVFQPVRPVMQYFGRNKHGGYIWGRRYLNTSLTAWVSGGWVAFIDPLRGGPASDIAPVRAFEKNTPHITCGRRGERYYAKLLPATH